MSADDKPLDSVQKPRIESSGFLPSNQQFVPITSLWDSKEPQTASSVLSRCLSCDRWAGTTVMGGGAYLLWSCRRAPNLSTKIVMIAGGSIMMGAGLYQGWLTGFINEYRGWPPV